FPPSVPSRYRFTACILSFEENLAIKNAPPIVNYVSNNWGALQRKDINEVLFLVIQRSFVGLIV
ncbi:hypothetical protein, partial [Bacillus toyonensis]|uniref:hypothetical protein n=1 Tax=Bacillus toyonensis TaxID=155322 RepID=UPI001E30D3DC